MPQPSPARPLRRPLTLLRALAAPAVAAPTVVALGIAACLLVAAPPAAAEDVRAAHETPPEVPGAPGTALSHVHCQDGRADRYPCRGVDLAAFVPRDGLGLGPNDTLNDIWGWTDPATGVEYALVGLSTGTAFVSLADPEHPVWLGSLPSRTFAAPWRDVKVHRDHAYVVADVAGHGIQVFDLTRLRSAGGPPVAFTPDTTYFGPGLSAGGGFALGHSHNVAVNEETGFAYAVGSNTCGGGLHMVDLADPRRPRFAGCFGDTGYIHDTQCVVYRGPDARHRGRELCFNSNVVNLSVVDVTDKRAPRLLATAGYAGNAYAHQGWLTEDHRFFLLGDEIDELRFGHRARTYIWDVSDVEAPRLVGHYDSPVVATDHNLYIRGNRVYEANYTSGLRILSLDRVAEGRLEEVAFFDTVPGRNELGTGSGAWSVYPFFASGLVIVSSIGDGLFVLRPHEPPAGPGPSSTWLQDDPASGRPAPLPHQSGRRGRD